MSAAHELLWAMHFYRRDAETQRNSKVRQKMRADNTSAFSLRLSVSAVNLVHPRGNELAAAMTAEHIIAKIKNSTAPFRINTSVPTEARR